MRLPCTAIILATAIALFASPSLAAAQEPVKSFDQLNTRLKPGDTIWVTDAQGREVSGKIQALAPEVITLKGDGPRTFVEGDVRLIREREVDSIKNGALIGLAVGAGIGTSCFIATAGESEESQDFCVLALAVYCGLGTAIGVGVDALIPGKKLVAYRAPGSAGSSQARLSIAPVVTRRATGVAVSFAF